MSFHKAKREAIAKSAEGADPTAAFLKIERARTPTALELKRYEYRTFAKEYVAPVVETAKTAPTPPPYVPFVRPKAIIPKYLETQVYPKEREAEEAVIRKEWETQVAGAEQQARSVFEARFAPSPLYRTPDVLRKGEKLRTVTPPAATPEQKAFFETQLSEWKSQQESAYQTQIKAWRKAWKPKGIAERIVDIGKTKPMLQVTPGKISYEPVRPFAGIAGVVASGESFVYSVQELTGKKAPRIPPTLSSALIGKGYGMVTGKPSDDLEIMYEKYGREYVRGTVVGDILLMMGLGKVAETVSKPVVASIKGAWKGSRPETWLIRQSEWYARRAARGIAPQVVASKGFPETFSMKAAEAAEMSWLLETTPKTSAITVTATEYAFHKAKVLPHLISRGGLISIGYLRELSFEKPKIMGGLPARELTFKTVMKTTPKTLPYVPSTWAASSRVSASMLSLLLGSAATVGTKIVPRVPTIHPIVTKPKPTRFEKIMPFVPEVLVPSIKKKEEMKVGPLVKVKPSIMPIVKPKIFEETIPFLGETQILEQPTKQKIAQITGLKQVAIQKTIQRQIQYQPPYRPPQRMFVPPKYPDSFGLPKKRRRKRKEEDVFGLYGRYPRFYPVASAKQFLKMVIG